jgi:ABC-type dipeptide/oligopeptide/nickel transport system permease subunit
MAQQRREELPSQSIRRAAEDVELGAMTPAEEEAEQIAKTRISSPGRDAWRRFRKNWAAMLALFTVALAFFVAIFAPFLHTTNTATMDFLALSQGPNPHHWFGTDNIGRDLYSRVLYGLRPPLVISFIGTAITVILGTIIGVVAGYFGGTVDNILARVTDVMFAFPGFILALILASLYGSMFSFMGGAGQALILVIVFAIVGWPGLMRFVRSLSLSMREQQFVEAARTVGSSHWKIIYRHLLPNMWGLILVQASFAVVGFIYTEAILSLFGLGVKEPNPDLGKLLIDGTSQMGNNDAAWIFPSLFLTILILAFTFLGDGIRDAVDPRSRG